jgi:hypothetical protein
MWSAISTLLTKGFKTSEFFLSIVALFVPIVDKIVQHWLDVLNGIQHSATAPGWETLLAGVGAAIVAAAYSWGRSLVKAKGVTALAAASPAPGGPQPSYADGSLTAQGNTVSTKVPGAVASR